MGQRNVWNGSGPPLELNVTREIRKQMCEKDDKSSKEQQSSMDWRALGLYWNIHIFAGLDRSGFVPKESVLTDTVQA